MRSRAICDPLLDHYRINSKMGDLNLDLESCANYNDLISGWRDYCDS
jgi:hypothetical protein